LRIHRRGHREHHVGRHQAALDQHRDLGEIVRDEVAPAALAAAARSAAEEQRGVAHVGRGGLVEVAVLAHRQDLRDPDVVEAPALIRQRGKQRGRFADPGRHDDHIAVAQLRQGLLGGAAFRLVLLLRDLHCRLLSSGLDYRSIP
jgi:hypothetical protein